MLDDRIRTISSPTLSLASFEPFVHVIFHCQNDAFQVTNFCPQNARGSEFPQLGLMDWALFHFRRPKIHFFRKKLLKIWEILGALGGGFLTNPGGWREKNWMGRPARSCPTGFSPSSASSSSHLRSQAQNFTEAPTFSIVCCLHLPALFVFLRKIQMRHELESKMRKNQRKLEMQYSFTSLRGGQLRSTSIPWTVTSH